MVPRIKVETVPSLVKRDYHVTVEISQYPIHSFQRPLRDSSWQYLEQVGEVGTQLIKEVFLLPGVSEVFIRPYELSVQKGYAFDWEDIEPGIIEALKKVFGNETPEIIGATYLPIPEEVPTEEVPTEGFFQRILTLVKGFVNLLRR